MLNMILSVVHALIFIVVLEAWRKIRRDKNKGAFCNYKMRTVGSLRREKSSFHSHSGSSVTSPQSVKK